MKITFVGDIDEGFTVDPKTGSSYPFKHGEPFEVPDDFGKKLLEQQPAIFIVTKGK